MGRPIATTALAIALLACEGAPTAPPAPVQPSVVSESAPEEFRQFQRDSGYPHSFQEYDDLPGSERCGTACGQQRTSGEEQRAHLCEQGMIAPADC
ncbi:hypothetical protein EIL87_03895 [Saccharopolyspora rhizosphaerae]|uniref:Lipoprotein n=1 Tax=Saccharopolyspora rhizosphaerae TaxID=2492662 RepID=A0A3R8P8W5_9PSEU|nr:hypothetical protein [Saccharopolyspora rhizosphaerae]RRO19263.1 hypothetical protein EIL87_03895 [Saccharopolyspora rhizosphaerae]